MGLAHNITLSTKDTLGQQFTLNDAYDIEYSNHYTNEGSGFGFISFSLRRKYGINYADIGFGFEVSLTKGLKLFLFHGIITGIEENNDDQIIVYGLGDNSLFAFDIVNFVLSDNRTNRWVTACNPKGSYRPDKFDHSLSWTEIIDEGGPGEEEISYDGIEITPRQGIKYTEDDFYYIRYRFEFGEIARRLTGDYKVAFPNNWPGRIDIVDAAENVIWTSDISGNGTLDLDVDNLADGNFVEIRFVVRVTGLNTAVDGTVYFRFWNINIISTTADVDATTVAREVLAHMVANYDYSDDETYIDSIGFIIPQAAYDQDKPLNEIMTEACSYGSVSATPLAWGTLLDDTRRMFLEVQDLTTIVYTVELADEISVQGDLAESYQKVYGKYTDTFGQEKRTSVLSATSEINALGGLYRKEVVDLSDVTSTQASQALQVALNENKQPKVTTDFSISEFAQFAAGGKIPVEEMRAGGIIQIPQMRTKETALLSDKRKGFGSFMLSRVEVKLDQGEVTLTPAENKSSFELYMERLQRLAKR